MRLLPIKNAKRKLTGKKQSPGLLYAESSAFNLLRIVKLYYFSGPFLKKIKFNTGKYEKRLKTCVRLGKEMEPSSYSDINIPGGF